MSAIVKIIIGIGLAIASFIPGLNIVVGMTMFGMGASMALGGIAQTIRGKPNLSSLSSSALNRTVTVRQPLANGRVIYGVANVGGVITYLETTGTDNEFLHIVLTLGAHELASIGTMQFDGVDVPLDGSGNATGTFAGLVHAEKNLGTREQAAFSGLVSASAGKWTTAHRQRGRPGVYVRLKWDQNKFPNGAPNITFDVTGRAVRDPRQNLLLWSEAFDNAAWLKSNATVVANSVTDPFGEATADAVTFSVTGTDGLVIQEVTPSGSPANKTFTFSCWLKAASSSPTISLLIEDQVGSVIMYQTFTLGTTWQRYSVTGIMTPGATQIWAFVYNPSTISIAYHMWGAQLEKSSSAGGYLKTTSEANLFPFVYSKNSALCLADYLMDSGYGLGALRRVPITAAMLSHSGLTAFDATKVTNGNLDDSAWHTDSAVPGAWLQVDLGAGKSAEVVEARIFGGVGSTYAGIYDLEYSEEANPLLWTKALVGLTPNVTGKLGTPNRFRVPYSGLHRYWRLLLTNTPGGGPWLTELQLYEPIISRDQLSLAAGTCDETVPLAAGGTENRYETDGAFDTSERPADALTALAGAMGGFAVYVAGKFSLYPGVWRAPDASLTFSDDDLAGPLKVTTRQSRRDIFNTVRGTFVSAAMKWQPTNFPTVSNSAYVAEDDGEVIYLDAQLPFTISNARAQRIAKLTLERARRQVTVQAPFKFKAYKFAVCDVIKLNHARFGWTNKTFEVQSLNLIAEGSNDGGIALFVDANLRETDADVYAWNPANDELTPAGVSAITVVGLRTAQPVTSLAVAAHEVVALDGSRGLSADLTWTAPADQYVTHGGRIHVYFKLHTDSGWTQIFTLDGAAVGCRIGGITPGVSYDYRVTAENTAGVFSTDTDLTNQTLTMTTSGMLTYRPLADPLSATDAGSSATINVASFTMRIQGVGDKSINSGSITGLGFNTLYYVYYDDAGLAGGAVTYQATTTKEVSLSSAGRFFVGSIYTPRDGAIDTIGNDDGGSGGQSGSVDIFFLTVGPVTGVAGSSGSGSITNPEKACDGDLTTFCQLTSTGNKAARLDLVPATALFKRYKSAALKIVMSCSSTGTGSGVAGTATITAPTGGDVTKTIHVGDATFGPTLFSSPIFLPVNWTAIDFQVSTNPNLASIGTVTINVYEAWIEAKE